ncbi:hypothetical protein HGRIS_007141 [Hohenbuehelia grisea]|uniref:Uncharacterized protein n=1 Tax=Hohenbuehelia grisea TaxID=104357 RepID=A0ABR3JBX0_9AGAR
MSSTPSSTPDTSTGAEGSRGRGRGRGKSRGGLGKYLRARGRGGRGRPAEFRERLLLDGEAPAELDEEQQAELHRKFARRQLGTNADRYKEEEPELDSDGEPIVEPEVDLSSFLERQRISDDPGGLTLGTGKLLAEDDDDEVDESLAHIGSSTAKGKVEKIEWDAALDEMSKEKAASEAVRDLKTRFRAKTEQLRKRGNAPGLSSSSSKKGASLLPFTCDITSRWRFILR